MFSPSTLSRRAAVTLAALAPFAPATDARKKRCRRLLARCKPGKKPRCCAGTVCGTSQIAGSRCCRQKDRTCTFSPTRDECCPGFFCSEADGVCVELA